MSAKHQYYFPCSDFLSAKERRLIEEVGRKVVLDTPKALEETPHSWVAQDTVEVFQTLDKENNEYFTSRENVGFINLLIFNTEINPIILTRMEELFPDSPEIHAVTSSLQDITKRYNGDFWRLCVCVDDNVEGGIHKDPKQRELANCNIPILPDYGHYRPTYFYTQKDKGTLVHTIDYAQITSPCLLNIQKWHSIGGMGWNVPKSEHKKGIYEGYSIGLQICYLQPYEEVRSMFQKNGWLSLRSF